MLNRNDIIKEIIEEDVNKGWFDKYEKKNRHPDYQLHREYGPCPYEGDLENARIILLLANPGYDKDTHQEEIDFINKGKNEWPLAGLHKDAPKELGEKWWRPHLKGLICTLNEGEIDEEKFQIISQRVAALQLVPWASQNFDDGLIESKKYGPIPSNQLMLELANKLVEKQQNAIILLMRCERYWRKCDGINKLLVEKSNRIFIPNSFRRPYVSEGNFSKTDGAWEAITKAINRLG